MRRLGAMVVVAGLAGTSPAPAPAEPYRLRADALMAAEAPAGLVLLQAEGKQGRQVTAEALVWVGAGQEDEAEALVVAVRAASASGAAEARLGRLLVTAGGLRPQHLDGAQGRLRLPYRLAVEAFAGSPVAAGQEGRSFDWLVGGRISRALGDWGSAGAAYLHRRDHGQLADEEVALDASGAASEWLDLSARAALDLVDVGLAEVNGAAGARFGSWRLELYGIERSPSRLLPATSLFSVLGDRRSRRLGAQIRWRAAPRLDLYGEGGALGAAGAWGELMAARAVLRLDDRGAGAIGGELRREWGPDGGWSGARVTARVPVGALVASLEGELAVPEHADGDGSIWPWGLAGLSRRFGSWEAAAAVEASASSDYTHRVDAIGRLTWLWEAP
ncbi:MAG TPA: hypothetical protein VKB80_35195 [Kofleriaceae bacterium]|nr:hypothetical protein [Kofleriaceae bacterium]